MKSKVKYATLVLIIGLLGLVILPSSVFAGPKYDVVISEVITSDEFETAGNKPGTRFNPFPKEELPVKVVLTFESSIFPSDEYIYDSTGHCFRWSPLVDEEGGLQELDSMEWEFHHIKISGNSLECRSDLFYEDQGAWDHYVLGINMESGFSQVDNSKIYTGDATINWTHYTENTKPRGQNPKIEFQQLKYTSPGEFTITITITITEAEVP